MSALQNGCILVGSHRKHQCVSIAVHLHFVTDGRRHDVVWRHEKLLVEGASHRTERFATNPSFGCYAVIGWRSACDDGRCGRSQVHGSEIVLGVFVHHAFSEQLFETTVAVKRGELFHVVAVQLVNGYAHNKARNGHVRLCLAFDVGKCGQRKEGYVLVHALLCRYNKYMYLISKDSAKNLTPSA